MKRPQDPKDSTVEFIVWGLSPKNPEHEAPLVTGLNSQEQAQAAIETLRVEHGCTELRVQRLDLAQNPAALWQSPNLLNL